MSTEERNRPVAVFDSGLGGISVLRQLYRILPNEHYIYMGDSKNAPYGEKTTEEVYELSKQWVDYFLARQAKAVVIACNTATSAAAARLRRMYPDLPIIGLEPALKPAAIRYAGTDQKILVLGTSLTLREDKFQHLLHQYENQAHFYIKPAPGLVEYIEQGKINTTEMDAYLTDLLQDYLQEQVAAVVLGCTHYPFAKDDLRRVLGEQVEFFDGAEGAARQLRRQLEERDMLNLSDMPGQVEIYNSEGHGEKESLSRKLFALA